MRITGKPIKSKCFMNFFVMTKKSWFCMPPVIKVVKTFNIVTILQPIHLEYSKSVKNLLKMGL